MLQAEIDKTVKGVMEKARQMAYGNMIFLKMIAKYRKKVVIYEIYFVFNFFQLSCFTSKKNKGITFKKSLLFKFFHFTNSKFHIF